MDGKFWLFKSEPGAYSFDDLIRDEIAEWDGVRNYQARNLLRDDIQVGDHVLFYHSNAKPPEVVGTAVVVKSGYPDHTAYDPNSEHPDPKSTEENPIWFMVDLAFQERFSDTVPLSALKGTKGLEEMKVVQKGSRLSVQPVTKKEYDIVVRLNRKTKTAAG